MTFLDGGVAENFDIVDMQPNRSHADTGYAKALATKILSEVLPFRRLVTSTNSCADEFCSSCLAPHLHKVVSAILQGKPISFALPAFPGKSPNLAKVLSPLPDMAEKLALQFLNDLCEKVKTHYAPGAQVILCSDGRVFSDVIGMNEDHVTEYQSHIHKIIKESQLKNIKTYTLDDLSDEQDFTQLRQNLMKKHGKSLEGLREKIVRGGKSSEVAEDVEAHRMYCGMVRFLVEDATHPGQTKSRTAIQNDCKVRAYEVIRRSNAWSELIAEYFPQAVRLSIHPQSCGAEKMGIQLLGIETWMTPWHGVAVDTEKGFVLMKRWEAEKLSAHLVLGVDGRPSHYKLR